MNETPIPDDLLEVLRQVDTPTVCNAVEVVYGRRGFDRFTRGTMQHSRPGAPAAVGRARTARIAGLAPPTEPDAVIRARRLDYYRAMARGPGPTLAVIEDVDFPACIAGWWGEVNAYIHRGLGLVGAVTNGTMRDLDVMPKDFPVLAGSIGPSHGYVHVREIGRRVRVMNLDVDDGDLVHADRHGAIVIPDEVLPDLKAAIATVFANEAIVLGPARSTGFSIETLEKAWAEFEARRT